MGLSGLLRRFLESLLVPKRAATATAARPQVVGMKLNRRMGTKMKRGMRMMVK